MHRLWAVPAAAALAAPAAVSATPRPVPVAPVVVADDPATEAAVAALVARLSWRGPYEAVPAVQPPARPACAGAPDRRAACYAQAVDQVRNADLVFVHVERDGETLRLQCAGRYTFNARLAVLPAAVLADDAVGGDQISALSGCLLGAVHGPPLTAPQPPPLPNGHFDRPLPSGVTYGGALGDRCESGRLADGRPYDEVGHGLQPGQRIGLNLAARGFAARLLVFRAGEADRPLATLDAPADGTAAGLLFTAPDEADYRFRVVGADPQARGRWQLVLDYERRIDLAVAPGQAPGPGCSGGS